MVVGCDEAVYSSNFCVRLAMAFSFTAARTGDPKPLKVQGVPTESVDTAVLSANQTTDAATREPDPGSSSEISVFAPPSAAHVDAFPGANISTSPLMASPDAMGTINNRQGPTPVAFRGWATAAPHASNTSEVNLLIWAPVSKRDGKPPCFRELPNARSGTSASPHTSAGCLPHQPPVVQIHETSTPPPSFPIWSAPGRQLPF